MRMRNPLQKLVATCLIGLMPVAAVAQWQPTTPTIQPAPASPSAPEAPEAPGAPGAPGAPAVPSTPTVPVADQAAQLEEQLIDLQVEISTLRSLARSVAPVAAGGPVVPFRAVMSDATAAQQIQALESEARSISQQLRQLTGTEPLILATETRALVPAPDGRAPTGPQISGQAVPGQRMPGQAMPGGDPLAPQGVNPRTIVQPETAETPRVGGWGGTTTVTPGNAFESGQPPERGEVGAGASGEILPGTVYPGYQPSAPSPQTPDAGDRVAVAPRPLLPQGAAPAEPAADAETAYQTAYGYLLQQDYGAAQLAFKEFLERYPTTPLAGNAQYWLGETHYVRGAYKNAAVAFLKGYEKYGDGNKGADSLLKLGMSLGKLRQNAAACSSLRELGQRYRNAPEATLQRAQAEMGKLGCPR